MGNDFGYFSHYPVLAAMVAKTTGPVMECGMGWGSTPLLRAMCGAMGRDLYSYDTSAEWLSKFEFMASDRHKLRLVGAWQAESCPMMHDPKEYGVIFIDCAPGEARRDLAVRLKDNADYLVLHDALSDGIHGSGGDYRYESVLHHFKHYQYYAVLRPGSLVLSNRKEIGLSAMEQERRTVL